MGSAVHAPFVLKAALRQPCCLLCAGASILIVQVPAGKPVKREFRAELSKWSVVHCSGDFGIGFFGITHLMAAYLLHGKFGADWTCFMCNILGPSGSAEAPDSSPPGDGPSFSVAFAPIDPFRRRVFLEPLGAMFECEGSQIATVLLNLSAHVVNITFASSNGSLSTRVRLRWEHTAPASRPAGASLQVACDSQHAATGGLSVSPSTAVGAAPEGAWVGLTQADWLGLLGWRRFHWMCETLWHGIARLGSWTSAPGNHPLHAAQQCCVQNASVTPGIPARWGARGGASTSASWHHVSSENSTLWIVLSW